LQLAIQQSLALDSWAWGVNGFFTVIGTVLAVMLGMIAKPNLSACQLLSMYLIGFRMVIMFACAAYLGALFVIAMLAGAAPKGSGPGG
jgi:hypothetical protein